MLNSLGARISFAHLFAHMQFFLPLCPLTIAAYSRIIVKCRQIILVYLHICRFFQSLCPTTIAAYSQINVKCRQISIFLGRIFICPTLCTNAIAAYSQINVECRQISIFLGRIFICPILFALMQLPLIHKLVRNVGKFRSLWPMPTSQQSLCRIRLVRITEVAKFTNNYIWKNEKCKNKINFERKYNILNE